MTNNAKLNEGMTMRHHLYIAAVATGFFIYPACANAWTVHFVKPTATGSGNCTSWANACTLPTALSSAQSGDEIWVMKTDPQQPPFYAPFTLKTGVKVYGGFFGTEVAASQSDPAAHLTIIAAAGGMISTGNTSATVLRGFTIRNGIAEEGAGIRFNNSNALIVQCVFKENYATMFGGAVSIRNGGSPQFINCIFSKNGFETPENPQDPPRTMGGGAVFVHNGTPTFVNCLFDGNKAWEGGVVHPVFGNPTFINCTLVNNAATIGYGGVFYDPEGKATFRNCILRSNTTFKGVGIAEQGFSGSTGTTVVTYGNVPEGWTGTGNIDADPFFINPDPANGDYRLQESDEVDSPCKNTGQTSALPLDVGDLDWDGNTSEPIPRDLSGFTRLRLGTVDMGAYEVQFDIE